MTDPHKYILRVTAGPAYDKQDIVHVNTPTPTIISTEHLDAKIHVRVKDFRGLPPGSPSTSPYFAHNLHKSDRYSIAFTLIPKTSISGTDLVFGNDFENPIRDRLPPGFGTAFNYVTKFIDPGLYGDVYGDKPYLYGPLASSVNVLRVGEKAGGSSSLDNGDGDEVIEEGAEGEDAENIREERGLPGTGSARMKYFLDDGHKKEWVWEEGRVYKCDFFNGYLDFNEFTLKLPLGLSINILGHWDGQALREHSLRYVLRNRATDTLLFVVSFTLVPVEKAESSDDDDDDEFEDADDGEEKEKNVETKPGGFEPNADDLD